MRFKKLLLAGSILVLGLSVLGLDTLAGQNANSSGNGSETRRQIRNQFRHRFIDQNCDGINDGFRDHDNDGIPNGQDPDWSPPEDGSGYHRRNGQTGVGGLGTGSAWNKSAFRGSGVCDGTGPRGRSSRRGRG